MSGQKGRSGRKPKDISVKEIQATLTAAAKLGARYIMDVLSHKKRPSPSRIRASELAIAHAIGKPKEKIELKHTGDMLTMKDIAELASQKDKGNGHKESVKTTQD